MKRTVYFHEDDYCQTEILPLAAKKFCLKQIGEIDEFAVRHSEGIGFSDMYVRDESPHSISEAGISQEKIAEVLDFLPEFDEVDSEYMHYIGDSQLVFARGIDNHMAVFWEKDENGIISAMWFGIYVIPENRDIWCKTLIALGSIAPLLLVDWCAGICVDLADVKEIENYINEIENYTE
ncbi:MAG: hypothetical protein K2J26_08410 [Ruminococcus sp.]|nr:hypothetical protein [Ruminococcus sp.]